MAVRDLDAYKDPKGVVMNGAVNDMMESVRRESEARSQALQRLLSAADSSKVFGQPVSSEGYTVIPAAEVASGGGFGSGMGFGSPRRRRGETAGESSEASAEMGGEGSQAPGAAMEGAGGGGGGGGGAMARPVAVIIMGPDGVRVKPVLDVTKLAITALGALAAATALSMRLMAKK
jgi:uncharacterized spore protein YtfJ